VADRYVSLLVTLSELYPGFQVTVYLKVEHVKNLVTKLLRKTIPI